MSRQNYHTTIERLAAYCVVQYKLLALYNPEINMLSMLKEISPTVIKAMRKRSEKNFKSLEEISKKTDERILSLQKQRPTIEESEEAKRIIKILSDIKKEFEELK